MITKCNITHPNIDIFLGGRFKELETKTVGQLLASLVGYHPLVLHVALVADQDDLGVVPTVGLDLCAPEKGSYIEEALNVAQEN